MRNYKPLLVHFENHASDPHDREASAAMKGRAKLMLKSLKQYSTLLFIHLMLDILHELKQLSLLFQKDGLTLQMVSDGLQTTCMFFVAMQTNPGPRLQRFLTEVGTGSNWQGVEINRTSTDDDIFNNIKLRLTNSFCEFVSERYESLETGILKAVSTLFDLSSWPEDTTALATFGTDELNVIMEHFRPVLEPCKDFVSEDAARREWLDLKILVARRYRHLDSQVLWQRLIQGAIGRAGQFQHMQVVAEISLVLPMSSSCCERGFSCMKRVKSDWRSRLANDTLTSLMLISMHGPPLDEYNSIKAVTKWWSTGRRSRRPQFCD
ncbi:zinc finger protein 862-like [Gadus chalcogrammus]|uniref:zinc finger protein 862-like n=1 Tax=Gadus chalcogrammus TaxID=1042646 RepID=UPI0024C48063|nr:zinc finger protein 862-like [Gadus chalcogrammus]